MSSWIARLGLLLLSCGLACATPITLTVRLQILKSVANSIDTFGGFSITLVAESASVTPELWEVSSNGDLTNLLIAASAEPIGEYAVSGFHGKAAHLSGAVTLFYASETSATFASRIDEVSYAFAPAGYDSPCGDLPGGAVYTEFHPELPMSWNGDESIFVARCLPGQDSDIPMSPRNS
jgi:hypothetical protein